MANGFRGAVEVHPEARREWWLAALAVAAACALSLVRAELPGPVRLVLVAATAARITLELRRRLSPRSAGYVARVAWLPGGRWCLETGRGVLDARLLHVWGRSLGPVIAAEWAGADGRRYQAWLWRHRCPVREWRRLRVHLRLA